MEIKLLDQVSAKEWDEAVKKYGTSVTQLHFFSQLYLLKGMSVSFITAYEAHELVGGCQLFEKKGFLGKIIAISPFGKNKEVISKIMPFLKKQLKKHFLNHIILENDDPNVDLFKEFASEKKATVIVNLEKPLDELKKNIDKKARWGVNKALEKGLIAAEAKSEEEWKQFYGVYCETCRKDGISPITYFELNLIMRETHEKKCGSLIVIKKENEIIAGSLIYFFGHSSTHSLNGSKKEFLEFQPNNLLYWKMIELSKEKNMKKFNLGGYAIDAKEGTPLYGINRFKMRWGGELITFQIFGTSQLYFSLIRLAKKIRVLK